MTHTILHADLLAYLRGNQWLAQNGYIEKAHAILCDPPYALPGGFMSKDWDAFHSPQAFEAWVSEWAGLLIDFVHPGALGLFFGGTRTYHRLAAGLEDAGWEITDSMCVWVHAQGFPKSAAIDKLLDKENGRTFDDRYALGAHIKQRREAAGITRAEVNQWLGAATKCEHYESTSDGFARVPTLEDWRILQPRLGLSEQWLELVERTEAEREVVGKSNNQIHLANLGNAGYRAEWNITAPATPLAARWQGYGTALKPAYEPVVIARAPRGKRTYAGLAREFGTGALAIDAARIASSDKIAPMSGKGILGGTSDGWDRPWKSDPAALERRQQRANEAIDKANTLGRWPANFGLVCTCESDDHAADCPVAVLGEQSGTLTSGDTLTTHKRNVARLGNGRTYGDTGTAARFFYTAKASAFERLCGLPARSTHPTMKPIQLATYLARLILPPELDAPRRLLVPFAGSGSEMIGALLAGWDVVTGIEREAEYVDLARARVGWWAQFGTYDEARKAYEKAKREPIIIPAPVGIADDKPAQLALFEEAAS